MTGNILLAILIHCGATDVKASNACARKIHECAVIRHAYDMRPELENKAAEIVMDCMFPREKK